MDKTFKYNSRQPLVHRDCHQLPKPNMGAPHVLSPVIGMPVISVKIEDHCYHGLCDMGASASAIPHSLYQEIMHDIASAEIE